MKILFLTLLLSAFPLFCQAQGSVSYSYDAAGNRISRTIVLDRGMQPSRKNKKGASHTDMLSKHHIAITPNPTDRLLQVSITGLKTADVCSMAVYKTSGLLVLTVPVAGDNTMVDLSSQPNGYYILSIDINGEKSSWKIIKK